MFNVNSGYHGYSMSNRAETAYDNGEMPFSKWTKEIILDSIERAYGNEAKKHCESMTVSELRFSFLNSTGWHHTGSYFQKTEFYEFDSEKELAEVMDLKHEKAVRKAKPAAITKWGLIEITVWAGSRKHPKKEYHQVVASWKEADGIRQGLAYCGQYGGKRDFRLIKALPGKPRKNAKVWKEEK